MNEQPPRFCHLVGPGFWFGDNEFVFGRLAILDITCASDAVLFLVSEKQFDGATSKHPVAWKAVAGLLSMNQA